MSFRRKEPEEGDIYRNVAINNIIDELYQSNKTPPLTQFILFSISIVTSAFLVFEIGKWQYDEYENIVNNKSLEQNTTYFNDTSSVLCQYINYYNINLYSTSVSVFLIILYILIYKRRVFKVKTFLYRNIGIPMIVSCWNKSDRLYTSFTYGIIAFNIYGIVRDELLGSKYENQNAFKKDDDVFGIDALAFNIFQVILIGISKFK